MIDWWWVFTNSLWLLGAAAMLAIFSHADWLASVEEKDLRFSLKHMAHNPGFSLALTFFFLGAGLGVSQWAERIIWFILAAASGAWAVRLWLELRKGSTL